MVINTILNPYTLIAILFLLVSFTTVTTWQNILHQKPTNIPKTLTHTHPIPKNNEPEKAVAGVSDKQASTGAIITGKEKKPIEEKVFLTPTPTQIQTVNAIVVTQPPTPTSTPIPNTPTPTVFLPTVTPEPEAEGETEEETSEVLTGELLNLRPVRNTVDTILNVQDSLLTPR